MAAQHPATAPSSKWKAMRKTRTILFCLGLFLLAIAPVIWAGVSAAKNPPKKAVPPDPVKEANLIAVAPPPFTEGIFPCSECHSPGDAIDPRPRAVPDHPEIVFEHDADNRWCLDCHDAKDRDKLHLADGRLITFEESYKLCGQCHGPELRDWKAGDHGKRTGSWSGKKEYLLCAHCHNPHSPKIKPIEPLPPPLRQENIK